MAEIEKQYHYHISDDRHDHAKFDTDMYLEKDDYPYVVTPIPDELKGKPIKFNWKKHEWYDNGQESFGQAIANLTDSVKKLDQANDNLQKSVQQQATNQQQSATNFQQMQMQSVQTGQMLGQVSMAVNQLNARFDQLLKQSKTSDSTEKEAD